MHLITNAADYSSLLARLERLTPDASRRWGTLAAPEMLRHLIDSFQAVTGARVASARESWTSRVILKFFALYVPLPWPKGFPTRPEVDPRRGGSRPGDFMRDQAELTEWIRRVGATPQSVTWVRHPGFGQLSEWEWARWGYLHVDHHLRQFGL